MLMDRASFIVTSHKGESHKHVSFLETQLSNLALNTNSAFQPQRTTNRKASNASDNKNTYNGYQTQFFSPLLFLTDRF